MALSAPVGASLAGEVHQVRQNLSDALSHDADILTQRQFEAR
jgi:hypothetical protein